jgi:hypothetical protein
VADIGRSARGEFLRLRRRVPVWLYLVAIPLAAGLLYAADASSHATPLNLPDIPPEFLAQRELLRQRDGFPQSILVLLDNGAWVAWATGLLAAFLTGSEFAWGTIRIAYLAAGDLLGFALARIGAIIVVAAVVILLLGGLGIMLPVLLGGSLRLPTSPPIAPLGAAAYAGAWLLAAVLYGAIGFLIAVLTRSAAAAVILTMVYIYAENFIAVRPELAAGGYPQGAALLLPIQSTTALIRNASLLAGRLDPNSAIPGNVPFGSTEGGVVVPLAWTIGLMTIATVILLRRDIID